jgi:hypothetical protein
MATQSAFGGGGAFMPRRRRVPLRAVNLLLVGGCLTHDAPEVSGSPTRR